MNEAARGEFAPLGQSYSTTAVGQAAPSAQDPVGPLPGKRLQAFVAWNLRLFVWQ